MSKETKRWRSLCRLRNRRYNAPSDMLETICQLDRHTDELEGINDSLHKEATDLYDQLAAIEAQNEHLQHRVGQLERECVRRVQQVQYLTRKLDQAKAEYAWLSSRTSNNKEQSAMKINLEMKDVTCGGEVVIGNLTVNAEGPDEMLDLFSTVIKNLGKPQKHTCTCQDGNEDKRPFTPSGAGRDFINTRAAAAKENAIFPGDVD